MIKKGLKPDLSGVIQQRPSSADGLMKGVEVLHTGPVNDDTFNFIIEKTRDLKRTRGPFKQEKELAVLLKNELDALKGKHWQVVLASSTLGAAVGHEAEHFMHFRFDNQLYLLWRTSDYN